jgi:hypothetical protein
MSQVQTFFWLKVGGICKKKNIAFSNLLSLIVKIWVYKDFISIE